MEFEQKTLANINIVRQITNTLGGGLKKSLGQNFLINQKSLLRFVNSINLNENDTVIEIGPGIGVVSYTLCQTAKRVILIEIDENKKSALEKVLENNDNYEIIWADATEFNFSELQKKLNVKPENLKIIGSLPYNVSKRIIANLLNSDLNWSEASFFLQKEVADSYLTQIPQADFLSNYIQIYADAEMAFLIPPEHFMPAPKVRTGVIHLKKHERFSHLEKNKFGKFIKIGFTQPRKTILNNLKSQNITAEKIESINIKPSARPSELTIEEWEKIYKLVVSY